MNRERLIELLALPLEEIAGDSNLQNEIIEYYKFIYGVKGCSSCKNKYQKYLEKLIVDGVEMLTEKTSQFKLRKDLGVLRINFKNGLFISQTEADDFVCIEFLKANPKRISMFEKYPENWLQLIQNNDEENAND